MKKNITISTPKQKLFVVRKWIMAESAQEAIKLDKVLPVDDVWVDDDWRKEQINRKESSTGFLI